MYMDRKQMASRQERKFQLHPWETTLNIGNYVKRCCRFSDLAQVSSSLKWMVLSSKIWCGGGLPWSWFKLLLDPLFLTFFPPSAICQDFLPWNSLSNRKCNPAPLEWKRIYWLICWKKFTGRTNFIQGLKWWPCESGVFSDLLSSVTSYFRRLFSCRCPNTPRLATYSLDSQTNQIHCFRSS